MNASECLGYLLDLAREGRLLDELRLNPGKTAHCILEVAQAILARLYPHDHDQVIGADEQEAFLADCGELAGSFGFFATDAAADLGDGQLLKWLLTKLIEILAERLLL